MSERKYSRVELGMFALQVEKFVRDRVRAEIIEEFDFRKYKIGLRIQIPDVGFEPSGVVIHRGGELTLKIMDLDWDRVDRYDLAEDEDD